MADNQNAPGVTVESLQAALQEERSAHLATQDELQAEQTAHLATKDALASAEQRVDEAGSSLAQATGIIAGQKDTITELEAQIVQQQVAPSEFPSFKQGSATYEVEVKHFKYKGADYSVEQLLKDKALQKELVGIGVGFLVKKEA